MILADWIFIGGIIACIIVGSLFGFGHLLKFITGGIVGIFISVLICYAFGGLILDIPAINGALTDLASKWAHIKWLSAIHLEIIIYYVVLFVVSMLLRKIIVKILQHVMETDVLFLKIINKVCGAVLFTALALLIMLFVFQIINWIGGETYTNFLLELSGSSIVKPMFVNNPLDAIVKMTR